jgi:hypothetical protein
MDKAPKQPTTPNKYAQTQTSIIKQAMTNATLLLTQVTPNDCRLLLYPIGLEFIPLPVGQEVVDGVLQPTLVAMDPRCNGLPGGISNNIAARGPESWSLVSVEDFGSEENLYDGFELHPPWTRDLLDLVPGSGGDAQVF